MPIAQAGTLQLNLSYDYNKLNNLKVGSQSLDDKSRLRLTHASLLNWSLNLSNKIAIEGILSYLIQERRINQVIGKDLARTQGFGDALLLVNIQLYSNTLKTSQLRTAFGIKAPLGSYNERNDIGLIYNAELQPGSGAWDAIGWIQWSQSFGFRPSLAYNATLAYSRKGENSQYLGNQNYQFGNEIQLTLGVGDRLLWGKLLIDPGLAFRYRLAQSDRFDRSPLPATGGNWIFMEPSLAIWLGSEWSVNFNLSFPVWAYVQDTQFSPTIRSNFGIYHRLNLWKGPKNDFSKLNVLN